MKCFLVIAVIAIGNVASAQLISVGAMGGVPITDTTGRTDESRPYIVGGSVEVRLPAGFALEADALYRRVGNTSYFGYAAGAVSELSIDRRRGNSWEFPLLGKYYFRRTSAWQPFIGTGFAFRTIGVNDTANVITSDPAGALQTRLVRGSFTEPLEVGATVVGGVRFHYGRIAILPQIRYTRWGGSNDLTRNNGTSLLLGLTF
jgi:opacity protein-like surface antigen